MTAGVGAIVYAAQKESERYINFDEIQKAVSDTKLDELLTSIDPIVSFYSKRLSEINTNRAAAAQKTKTIFDISDNSGGFAKKFNPTTALYLVKYEATKLSDSPNIPNPP